MIKFLDIVFVVLCWPLALAAQTVPSATAQPAAAAWNELKGEKLAALQIQGDAVRGAEAFQPCQGCHKRGAMGTPSGAYPRLAGQHATVLIEQITDIRSGRRLNPKMEPFADGHVLTTQDIADVAVYLQALPIQGQTGGKGPGTALARGSELYAKDCVLCHGERGQGSAQKFVPLLAGQHYGYLLREVGLIRDEKRGNANPDMVKVIKSYSAQDLEAVCDYVARLSTP